MERKDDTRHPVRDAIRSSVLFGIGYKLKDSVYLKNLKIGRKGGAALGAAFALIPTIMNDEDDNKASFIATGFMALTTMNSRALKKTFADNSELFETILKTMKIANERQKEIKSWFIEARQKVFRENEMEKGYVKGLMNLGGELLGVAKGNFNYKKSQASYSYAGVAEQVGNMSLDEFKRMGKKVPYEFYDYYYARKTLEEQVGKVKLGSGFLTATGHFSKVEDGKLTLDVSKFISEDANYVSEKITFLNSLPKTFTEKKEYLNEYIKAKDSGLEIFQDALKNGKTTRGNEVSYASFMETHAAQIKHELGDKADFYFNKDGTIKYLDILGDQKFSDNILYNTKSHKMIDASWYSTTNIFLDSLKGAEGAFRSFFKSSPMAAGNSQFKLLDFLGVQTKLNKQISGDKMKNFFVVKEENFDYKKTLNILDAQIKMYKLAGDEKWRERHKFKTMSQALYNFNKVESNVFSPRIKTAEDLNKTIKLLEYKRSQVADIVEKTGGFYNKSPMYGLDKRIDKATKRFYVEKDNKNKITLFERVDNKVNTVFHDNKAYIKENGVLTKLEGSFKLDYSPTTKVLQAKKDKKYYTTRADKAGKYVERDEVAMPFNFDYFKNIYGADGGKKAFKYLKESDLNFVPYFSKNGFKANDNFIEENMEKINNIKNYIKANKNSLDKKNYIEIAALLTGAEKQTKQFYNHYKGEVDKAFSVATEKYKEGMIEIRKQIKASDPMKLKLSKYTKDLKLNYLEAHLDVLTAHELESTLGEHLVKNEKIENFLKIKKSYEKTMVKYDLVKEARSVLSVDSLATEKAFKKSNLIEPHHIKEDIIINTFNTGKDYEEFKNIFGTALDDNLLFHKESLMNKNRIVNVNTSSGAIVKHWGTDFNFKDGKNAEVLYNDTSAMSNDLSIFMTKGFESFENSLEVLGIPKLSNYHVGSTARYAGSLLMKRVLPAYALYSGYQAVNSLVDTVLPDSTPIFGQGITSASFKAMAGTRMAVQVAINGIGMGAVFRKLEHMFPGMLTDNGLFSPLQLSATNEEMHDQLFEGKEIVVKKNRFWFSSGRQKFEGGETEEIRPSLLYLGQQRTSGLYRNKMERFLRSDFLPTKIMWTMVDPYMEERINQDTRPVAKSGKVFNDIPIIGEFMNTTIGKILKPTKYFNKEEWYVEDGVMLNPDYNGQDKTLKFVNYDNSSEMKKAIFQSYEEIKNMMGMRGYMIGQGITSIFGGDNPLKDKMGLETLDTGNETQDKFDQLKLGGLFGLTEPLRRMLAENANDKTISPLRNNSMPDWMPQNYFKDISHGNIYNNFSFGEFVLPGKVYEKYNKLHSDDLGKYGLVDRLKILSIVAPYSKEFRHYKFQAMQELPNMDEESKMLVYQSLSYAKKHKDRDVNENNQQKAKLATKTVTIQEQRGPLEFIGTDHKRYRLAGLSYDTMDGRADSKITEQMNELTKYLSKGSVISGVTDANAISAVKTDNDGEFIEIYAPELDMFKDLKVDNYLRYSTEKHLGITSKLIDTIKNAKKPGYLEKLYGSKDILHRYYYENVLDPSFKDWGTPIESFITPLIDTAANGGISGYVGSMNISMRMGDFGDPTMPLLTTLSFLKGQVLGKNTVDRIEDEDQIKNMIEYAKHLGKDEEYRGNFNSSIYDMNYMDGLSKVKNYLTMTERKYLDNIVNETNEKDRQRLYDGSSDRLKMVLGHLWEKQSDYNNGNYVKENIELPVFTEELPEYYGTNDSNFNDALFKKELGFDLQTYEKRTFEMYGESQLKEWKSNQDLAKYIERVMKKRGNYQQRVLSTIMPSDMLLFDKEAENDNI